MARFAVARGSVFMVEGVEVEGPAWALVLVLAP